MLRPLSSRSWVRVSRLVLAALAPVGTVILLAPSGTAGADVCASAGRRISVGGCVNIANAIEQYAPPPAYYAPLPEDVPPPPPPPPPPGANVSGCIGYNGRWVHAGGCN